MKLNHLIFLRLGETASLNIRPQVIDPPQSATFATSQQTYKTHHTILSVSIWKSDSHKSWEEIKCCEFGNRLLAMDAIIHDEARELMVFLDSPRAALEPDLVTTGLPSHYSVF